MVSKYQAVFVSQFSSTLNARERKKSIKIFKTKRNKKQPLISIIIIIIINALSILNNKN